MGEGRFRWDGQEFDLISVDDMSFNEIDELEAAIGAPRERWTVNTSSRAGIWWSIHAGRPDFTYAQSGDLRWSDIEWLIEPGGDGEDGDGGPPDAAGESPPAGTSPQSSPSTSTSPTG